MIALSSPNRTALVVIDLQQGVLAVDAERRPTGEVVANTIKLTDLLTARE